MPTPSKGMNKYNELITEFLIIDLLRGKSYGQLTREYKIDKTNIRKRIKQRMLKLSPHGEIGYTRKT